MVLKKEHNTSQISAKTECSVIKKIVLSTKYLVILMSKGTSSVLLSLLILGVFQGVTACIHLLCPYHSLWLCDQNTSVSQTQHDFLFYTSLCIFVPASLLAQNAFLFSQVNTIHSLVPNFNVSYIHICVCVYLYVYIYFIKQELLPQAELNISFHLFVQFFIYTCVIALSGNVCLCLHISLLNTE